MIVSMWMTRNPFTVTANTSVARATLLLTEKNIRRLPVVEAGPHGPRLVGIVSATDLFQALPHDVNPFARETRPCDDGTCVVADVMRRDPVTTTAETPIEHAARLMRDHKVSALPVLRHDALVGVITESDIFRAFVSMFDGDRDEVRITFDVAQGENTFVMMAGLAKRHGARVLSLMTSQQNETQICVIRLTGPGSDAVVDGLWESGHRVVNVLRTTRP